MSIIGTRALTIALTLATCASAATAQVNPLGKPDAPANPLAPAADNPLAPKKAAKIDVPDFVKPGARFVYLHTSSLADRPHGQPPTADSGIVQHDIVAVLPDRVLAVTTTYVKDLNSNDMIAMADAAATVTADKVGVSGGSIWAPKATLANLQSIPGMEVSVGDWPMNGKTYKAHILRFEEQNALTIRAFDQGTGLMLSSAFGAGRLLPGRPDNGGLSREVQRNSTFQAYRTTDLPWLKPGVDAKPPAWTANVKRMTYRGVQRLVGEFAAAGLAAGVPVQAELAIDDRGDTWATGTVTVRIPDQPPVQAKHAQGLNSLQAYWFSPEVLRNLKPGVLDTDPTLGTVIEYAVEQRGPQQLGVITQRSANGVNVRSWAYSLDDGALVGIRFLKRNLSSLLEYELAGRE